MSAQPMVLVEADRVWYQQHANSARPEVESSWKPIRDTFVGRVKPAPPSDTRLRFDRFRTASAGRDRKGLIGLGPPSLLPPGRYRTTWWLTGSPASVAADEVIVTCGIDVRRETHAKIDVLGATLKRADRPFSVVIDVHFETMMNEVAFVTWWHGHGEVAFLRTECMRH